MEIEEEEKKRLTWVVNFYERFVSRYGLPSLREHLCLYFGLAAKLEGNKTKRIFLSQLQYYRKEKPGEENWEFYDRWVEITALTLKRMQSFDRELHETVNDFLVVFPYEKDYWLKRNRSKPRVLSRFYDYLFVKTYLEVTKNILQEDVNEFKHFLQSFKSYESLKGMFGRTDNKVKANLYQEGKGFVGKLSNDEVDWMAATVLEKLKPVDEIREIFGRILQYIDGKEATEQDKDEFVRKLTDFGEQIEQNTFKLLFEDILDLVELPEKKSLSQRKKFMFLSPAFVVSRGLLTPEQYYKRKDLGGDYEKYCQHAIKSLIAKGV